MLLGAGPVVLGEYRTDRALGHADRAVDAVLGVDDQALGPSRKARQGLLSTTRGRGGGLQLLPEPSQIRIGDVVRASETDFRLVECFGASTHACGLAPDCRLKHLLDDALQADFRALDAATLADLAGPPAAAGAAAARPALTPVALPARRRAVPRS